MNIDKLINGNLMMTADVLTRRYIVSLRKQATSEIMAEAQFICEVLGSFVMGDGVSYEQLPADAPIIFDGNNTWVYMHYKTKNFLEELADGATITWQKN